ncbi:OTU domain-containing protein 3 isoform X2 [Caloenas nicobarica]|uniref:OTU domain-containing protein 3 isoform X2 n=1 Tax=Caloenas nicobarica TaxID=187106 RepID=UPI0032B85ABC
MGIAALSTLPTFICRCGPWPPRWWLTRGLGPPGPQTFLRLFFPVRASPSPREGHRGRDVHLVKMLSGCCLKTSLPPLCRTGSHVSPHYYEAGSWLHKVQGTDKTNAKELHIAYRYGEHYDSVRRISDDSEAPAYLQMEMFCKNGSNSNKEEEVKPQKRDSENEVEGEDAVQKVCKASGCSDTDLVSQILEEEGYNIESAIFAVLQVKELERISTEEQCDPQSKEQNSCSRTLREANGSGPRICGNRSSHRGETENSKGQAGAGEENRASRNAKVSKKQKKEQQRLEKKKRQEERHRQKALATKSDCAESGRRERDSDNQVTLVKATAALNI